MKILKYFFLFFVFAVISFFYLYKLGEIPHGFFCDEAGIGVEAGKIITGQQNHLISPFFYNHFGYYVGNLEVFSTIPFVALFGLNEFSVRLASVFFLFLTSFFIYLSLKKLDIKNAWVSVLIFACSPIIFHISRINFGHLPGYFFLVLGFYCYIIAIQMKRARFSWFSGVMFGIASYAYNGFMISVPLFIVSIAISNIVFYRTDWRKYKYLAILIFFYILMILPIVINLWSNPTFSKRLTEKGGVTMLQKENLIKFVEKYPSYYSLRYLFIDGENSLGGIDVTRHTVKNYGILLKSSFVFIILGLFFILKSNNLLFFLPFFFLFFLFPFPDLLSNNLESPPYAFAFFPTLFIIPFLIAPVIDKIRNKLLLAAITLFVLGEFSYFYVAHYLNYPKFSTDYQGWQAGPREIIAYFQTQKNNYDQLYMTARFNEPQIFLEFYDPQKTCNNCFIGGNDRLDFQKRQLFAFWNNEQNNWSDKLKQSFVPIKYIYLPDKSADFVIGEFKTQYN